MDEYISRNDALLHSEIIRVYSKDYGNIDVVPVEYLADIPSADVQPVKHGRWSECYTDTHHYSGICSVCGKASIKSLAESLYAFCPKCGAQMDGDTK